MKTNKKVNIIDLLKDFPVPRALLEHAISPLFGYEPLLSVTYRGTGNERKEVWISTRQSKIIPSPKQIGFGQSGGYTFEELRTDSDGKTYWRLRYSTFAGGWEYIIATEKGKIASEQTDRYEIIS